MTGRIAVIGGGLAGIAAALDSAAAGAQVTVLEVRPRLGGAAYSFDRDGLSLDNGQHVFLRCCEEYIGLLDRLGSRKLTALQPRLDLPIVAPGGRVARLRRARLPAPLHLAPSLARYRHLKPLDRARAGRASLELARLTPDDPRLDLRTLGDWLREHGQGPAVVEALWDVIARPTLNLPAERASLALAVKVFRTGLLDAAPAGDVGWATAPLGELHDRPARRALASAGAEVRLRWGAERVVADRGRWRVEGRQGSLDADAVVVAVPHDRAAAIVPRGALDPPGRLRALGSSPIVNLHVAYDRPVTRLPIAAGVRSPVQWVFDRTRSSGLERGQLLSISQSAADAEMPMPADALRARFLPALAELFPRAANARVERFHVTREHAGTFSAAPGVARLRPDARTQLPGLSLAGAYTATGWPATMEGAVRSGRAAAREALAALARVPDRQPLAA